MRRSASADAPFDPVAYRADRPAAFAAEAAVLQDLLAPCRVGPEEHIGSTAVPGTTAKPVIDIVAPVASLDESRPAIDRAATAGCVHLPCRPDVMPWFCGPSPAHRTHHLHLVPCGGSLWTARLALRDALRRSPALAAEEAQLKAELARRHRTDREADTDGKTGFAEAVLRTLARTGGPTTQASRRVDGSQARRRVAARWRTGALGDGGARPSGWRGRRGPASQIANNRRTPSAAIAAPRPRATTSPRCMTR
ncbi:MAG: GrpB family protein [Gammaproteobacteria bacterium]